MPRITKQKKESHERAFSRLLTGRGLRGLILWQNRGFPLMAASVPVQVMPVFMRVLMGMSLGLMAMLMPFMAMRLRFMGMLMLMLVLAVAAHRYPLLSDLFLLNFSC